MRIDRPRRGWLRLLTPPAWLNGAGNLAAWLSRQGKYADAERIEREVLGARRRVLGEEHPDTLASAGNLAAYLSRQGK